MVSQGTTSEYLLTQKTAEEYRSRGYEVVREAALDASAANVDAGAC